MNLTKNTLLILGAILIIVGAILKITHLIEPWNDWLFIVGLAFGLIYLILKMQKPSTVDK